MIIVLYAVKGPDLGITTVNLLKGTEDTDLEN